jgi:hypothetical protein
MGIYEKLTSQGSNLSQYDGTTPPISNMDVPTSTLHYEYSINGNPNMVGFPEPLPPPSLLDLNGVTPPKYIDNLPEGLGGLLG